jgi:hypothetical protein
MWDLVHLVAYFRQLSVPGFSMVLLQYVRILFNNFLLLVTQNYRAKSATYTATTTSNSPSTATSTTATETSIIMIIMIIIITMMKLGDIRIYRLQSKLSFIIQRIIFPPVT